MSTVTTSTVTAEFEGLKAVVTGGASGIGLAIADHLADRGATVAVLDRDTSPVADGRHVAVSADVKDDAAVRAALVEATDRLGGLDILVNNAGIGAQGAWTPTTTRNGCACWTSTSSASCG